jgi:carboxyl-terminal processing protease
VQHWVIFNYATHYHSQHATIDSADVFRLTDAEYNDFVQYAKNQKFEYETGTEQLFAELKKVAKDEKYYEGAEKEFEQLFTRIEPRKEADLIKFKDQIKEYLENEIVGRYYLQRGRAQNALPVDRCVLKSKEVFSSNYSDILKPVATKN